ncbi:von Willebrand factor type A domain-containing protein [Vannielia sp.]|uniref:vWA domain-containing protein n=1 Tax=Vannielia sp. TaxID=2813045 RepID=UPI0026179648|nr:von Willebrand factor type A domain-containing protein [Vannielia sp.]MDF1873712.1 von Willebrand factor type A domain-containing protein [Vannielia sp.]
MSEHDLDKLKAALKAAPPAPDSAAKAAHMAAAMAAFDDEAEKTATAAQGSASGPRPTPESRQKGWLWTGVQTMLDKLTTKAGLAATTGIVAAGLAAVVILPQMGEQGAMQPGNSVEKTAVAEPTIAGDIVSPESEEAEAAAPQAPKVTAAPEPMAEVAIDDAVASKPTVRHSLSTGKKPTQNNERSLSSESTHGLLKPSNPPVGATLPTPDQDRFAPPPADTEAFPEAATNPVKVVSEEPVSTFSIDVDTASYSVVRSSLNAGRMPPADAVRIEEMVNYFPYGYPAPTADDPAPFKPTVTVGDTPWNDGTKLVTIALQGELPVVEDRPPLNLVFLIDSSGSMNQPNKLPLLKQSLRLMLPELRPEDEVAIVAYAGSSGLVLEPTPAGERSTILTALDRISAGGGTAGEAGLQQAYSVAEQMTGEGEISRVLLATDGDFNVGLSGADAMKTYIKGKRDSGTYLSVLGFGRGNLNDATMQALAQNGNGQAAYIDTLSEARKVLVDQLTGALFPIASDVKIQVEFNPAQIAEYRLIGYETRALKREDFNNDKVDAGDIGAGHSVTALYEVTPVGSPAVLNAPLRYAAGDAPQPTAESSPELGFLKMRWKEPGESVSELLEVPIMGDMAEATDDTRFATAIAAFGQLLKDSDYIGDYSYEDAIALANSAKGDDPFGYRAEAVQSMRLAESLSQ